MGGSERSGPEHASASLVDGIVWVLTPDERAEAEAVASLEAWNSTDRRTPDADVGGRTRSTGGVRGSHLPQIASTALMGLAATEEADEPDILLLAAGGFRILTRLASSTRRSGASTRCRTATPSRRRSICTRPAWPILRAMVVEGRGHDVEETFDDAKRRGCTWRRSRRCAPASRCSRFRHRTDPGALAELTSVLAEHSVNIEDLQIVHSPEGGRGTCT